MTEINSVLRESAEKYQFLINNILDVIIEIDLAGTFTFISPKVYDMFGYQPEEIMGTQFFSYIHPDDMPFIMEAFEKAIKAEEIVAIEYRVKHKEGHYIPVFAKGSLVKINDKAKIVGVLRDITEHKEAEEKLHQSDELFRMLFNTIAEGVVLINNQGQIIKANLAAERVLGLKRLDIEQRNYVSPEWEILRSDGTPMPANEMAGPRAMKEKHLVENIVMGVKRPDDTVSWINVSAAPIKDETGGVLWVVGTFSDITEQKRVEKKLKESEDKYRSLFESSPYPILLIDINGTIVDYNSAYQKTFGWEEKELADKKFYKLDSQIPSEFLPIFLEKFKDLIEGKLIEPVEAQVYKKSGELIWTNNYASIVKLENSKLIQIFSEDITERKKAEKLLKQSEEKYRMIFTGASDPIAILDDVKIIDCNDITVKLFGYDDKNEIVGIPPWKISPQKQPDGRDSVEKANEFIKKALSGEPQRFYWKHIKKDGTLFDAEISLSSFKLENKEYTMSIIRDITERKKAERELREISQLKTELIERTSHELKTPLISIKGFTDLLLDLHKETFDGDVLSILGEIQHGTERLETIINKLLESSLLESGKIQFKPSKEDLSFLIRFCVKNLRGLAKTRNHFISLDISDKLVLNFEKERIYEVISHLIVNAIKYTPPYGEIKINTEKTDELAIVTVQDNGIGLSEDEQKKIFTQFGKIERYGQGWDIGIEGREWDYIQQKK